MQLHDAVERYGARERLFAAALSSLAGYVDAVGFVQSKGFFVSFMSGNSTRLGVGLVGSVADALAAAGLLTSFILGVTAGSLMGRASGGRRVPTVLTFVAALMSAGAALGVFNFMHASLALTAFAMGALNATLERQGRVRVGLTYMTGSVVKVGQALADRLTGRDADWLPPLILWLGFLFGAAAGAIAATRLGFDALWLGTVITLALAVVGHMLSSSLAEQN